MARAVIAEMGVEARPRAGVRPELDPRLDRAVIPAIPGARLGIGERAVIVVLVIVRVGVGDRTQRIGTRAWHVHERLEQPARNVPVGCRVGFIRRRSLAALPSPMVYKFTFDRSSRSHLSRQPLCAERGRSRGDHVKRLLVIGSPPGFRRNADNIRPVSYGIPVRSGLHINAPQSLRPFTGIIPVLVHWYEHEP